MIGLTNRISTLNLSNSTSLEIIGESAFDNNQITVLNIRGTSLLIGCGFKSNPLTTVNYAHPLSEFQLTKTTCSNDSGVFSEGIVYNYNTG